MDNKVPQRGSEKAERNLEELHESHFPPADTTLRRLLDFHEEKRSSRQRVVDTVVTYGAYEEPI